MVFFMESLQNKRSRNEDSYCHMDIRMNHEATVSAFAVADGMGGMEEGKRYSSYAISFWYQELVQLLMSEQFKDCSLKIQIDALETFSQNIFSKINARLYEKGMNAGVKGGTTLTTALHLWDTWIIANCGDSPAYLLKEGELSLCSEIQNVAWQMVREKKTQVGSSIFYQSKNRLMEYLGRREDVHPHVKVMEDEGIQALLLGSDGAFGDLTDKKMEKILSAQMGSSIALTDIMNMAREGGETDNQTAFLIYPAGNEQFHSVATEEILPIKAMESRMEKVDGPMEDRAVYRELEDQDSGLLKSLFSWRRRS